MTAHHHCMVVITNFHKLYNPVKIMRNSEKHIAVAEKRKFPRMECSVPVGYAILDEDYTALIENISYGGVYIDAETILDIGQEILLNIQLTEDRQPFTVIGEVAWHSPKGMGVKFKMGFDLSMLSGLD